MTFKFWKKEEETDKRTPVAVYYADERIGLSNSQVAQRAEAGYVNTPVEPPSKSVKQIILTNVFTYFNIIFFILAGCLIAVRAWNNLMFMGVIFVNMAIGIVQELRSKKTLDELNLLNAPKATVVRNGQRAVVDTAQVVRDDVVVFSAGNQIYADAVVISGECLVNESLITGEPDEIKKREGDSLMSGSFLVSGSCTARLTAVGVDSFVNRLTMEAKKSKKRKQSEMMRSLSLLVKWIGIIIIPFGIIMCIKEVSWLGRDMYDGVVSTVAALIGMIPEGLYLLTSLALVASILRLSRKNTLVHEMGCIETLARVDTLCVDKTGTITENKMVVDNIKLLCEDRFIEDDVRMIMADYVYAMKDDNDTMAALRRYFTGQVNQEAEDTLPFTSVKKYGGVSFHEDETYLLGAPEILLGAKYSAYSKAVEKYSASGCRVLLLAMYDGGLKDEELGGEVLPIALILLSNKIRQEAPETFRYFVSQGVTVKVISGDNPVTVSEVAKRAGIANADRYIDARNLTDDKMILDAAERYVVFGRVTPEQKRKLVQAMKKHGHTVAMTGDGVNDVLALKEADCSVAMASGSDVAAQVSHIVLMESDFSVMPQVVAEGRRVINNIERSATLFLVKNIFSFVLALITLIFSLPYPLSAAQLTLYSTLGIGFPAFVLALEPNNSIVSGRFMSNVLRKAFPPALTDVVLIVGLMLFYLAFDFGDDMLSTVCTVILGIVGFLVLWRICRPFTKLRMALLVVCVAGFILGSVYLDNLFTMTDIGFRGALLIVVFALLSPTVLTVFYKLEGNLHDWLEEKLEPLRQRRNKKRSGGHIA